MSHHSGLIAAVQELLQGHCLVVEFHSSLVKNLVAHGGVSSPRNLIDALSDASNLGSVVLADKVAVELRRFNDVGKLRMRALVLFISLERHVATGFAHGLAS